MDNSTFLTYTVITQIINIPCYIVAAAAILLKVLKDYSITKFAIKMSNFFADNVHHATIACSVVAIAGIFFIIYQDQSLIRAIKSLFSPHGFNRNRAITSGILLITTVVSSTLMLYLFNASYVSVLSA